MNCEVSYLQNSGVPCRNVWSRISLTVADKNALRSSERRILRKIFDLNGTEVNGE